MKLKTHQKVAFLIICLILLNYGLWIILSSYLASTPVLVIRPLMSANFYHSMGVIASKEVLQMDQVEKYLSVWRQVPPFMENTVIVSTQKLTVTPLMVANGGEVTVVWKNIPECGGSGSVDWVGLYCPSRSPHSKVIDFWWVKDITAAANTYGIAKFKLYNVRTDCQFRYFRSDTSMTKLVTVSDNINFVDSQNAHLHVHLALTGSPTEMRIQWTTGKNCVPTVHYGSSPDHLLFKATGVSNTYKASDMCGPPANMSEYFIPPGHLHDVLLTGLTPNTQYYYQVSGTGVSSEVLTFRTPPPPGSDTPISFVIYGDMDITPHSDQTASSVLSDIERGSSFVLHIGDLSYAVGQAYRWDEWMTLIEPLSSRVPYMVSVGNHEQCISRAVKSENNPSGAGSFHPAWGNYHHDSGGECGVPISKRFHMPESGNGVWWYSFKYGLVHIVQLSMEHDLGPGSVQHTWLERELKSVDRETTPWLIVTGHRPLYNSELYPSDTNVSIHLRRNLEDLFYAYGVDMFVGGHFHAYERMCSVYKEICSPNGIVHVTVGCAGMFLDTAPRTDFHWSKHFEHSYGYGRVTVANRTALHWEYVRSEDRVVSDHIWLVKVQ